MITITIHAGELYDERTNVFISLKKDFVIQMEHSLLSISKWESKWCKPFLSDKEKTREETLDYFRCMTITPNVDCNVFQFITESQSEEILEYIKAPMTATWFSDEQNKGGRSNEQITSELIYYWMVQLSIPFECQKWHLNRLLTFIRVCSIKNAPKKKMSQKDVMNRNAQLNAARRKKLNTKG